MASASQTSYQTKIHQISEDVVEIKGTLVKKAQEIANDGSNNDLEDKVVRFADLTSQFSKQGKELSSLKNSYNRKIAFPCQINVLIVASAIIAIGLIILGVANLYLWSSLPLTICSFAGAGLLITLDVGLLVKSCHRYHELKNE